MSKSTAVPPQSKISKSKQMKTTKHHSQRTEPKRLKTVTYYVPQKYHGWIVGTKGSQAKQFQSQGVKVEVPGKLVDSCKVTIFYYDERAFESVKAQLLDILGLRELSEEELVEANFHVPEHLRGKLIGTGGQCLRELEHQFGSSIAIPERGRADAMVKAVISRSKIAELQEALTFNLGFLPEIQVRRFGETTLEPWKNKRKSLQNCGTKRKWSETENADKSGPPKKKSCSSQIPLLLDNLQEKMNGGLRKLQQKLEENYAKQQEEFKAQYLMFQKEVKSIRDAYDEEYREELKAHADENARLRKQLADAEERERQMKDSVKQFTSAFGLNIASASPSKETNK